jgi:hypothetical protein
MLQSFHNWVVNFDFTSWMGFGLYWVPASLCAVGYTLRAWSQYQTDVADRAEAVEDEKSLNRRVKFYHPRITVGSLLGWGWVTLLPVVNIWAAVFDVAPRLFSSAFSWLGRVFDQPLVPKRKVD